MSNGKKKVAKKEARSDSSSEPRRCVLDPEGGPVTVRLEADNLLRAVGAFALYDATNQKRLSWKMAAGDEGIADKELEGITPSSLKDNKLTLRLRCCSLSPQADKGRLAIQIIQRGSARPLFPLAQWEIKEVPHCEGGQAVELTDRLLFILE